MAAIDKAVEAMSKLGDKHKDKMINLFSGQIGQFWTREAGVQKSLFPSESQHRNWSVFILHDGYPKRVETFPNRELAREFRNKELGGKPLDFTGGKAETVVVVGRDDGGKKVRKSCILVKASSERARELAARLPKIATKRREPKNKTVQLDMFR